jgi:hypothetical protein
VCEPRRSTRREVVLRSQLLPRIDTRTTRVRALAPACVVAAVAAWPSDARADLDLGVSFAAAAAGKRELPALRSEDLVTSARTIDEGGRVPNRGGIVMLGGRLDFQVVVDDRWIVPFIGVGVYGAVGSYPTTVSALDGSVARLRPWTAYEIDALLPGFGWRMNRRRWMFAGDVRLGVGFFQERVSVAAGADSFLFDGAATSLLVDVDLVGCRRLDPLQRVCLQVTPRIYDFGFANGGTIGLRWELGP